MSTLGGALAGDHLAHLRDERTSPASFRRAAAALATLVVADVLRDLESHEFEIHTPLATARVQQPARRVTLVPVLRAGLALMEPALRLLPENTRVGFLGMARDETTLQPSFYLERLPPDIAADEVLVLDVMLATGGSAVAAIDAVKAVGATHVRLACIVAAPEGIAEVHTKHPDVPISVAVIDDHLDSKGFIVPGLGDAGDRLYGTAGG